MTSPQIGLIIADDHPVLRLGVRTILSTQPDFTILGEASDGEEALQLVRELQPDVLILDLVMPRLPGLETLREITGSEHPVKTLMLTGTIDQKQILEALQLGARGVVLKDAVSDELVSAVRAISQGHHWLGGRVVTNLVQVLKDLMVETAPPPKKTFGLTAREQEVVALVVEGCTNKDVGTQLGISEETVKRHMTNIFDKVGVSSRLELAVFALHHGLGPAS